MIKNTKLLQFRDIVNAECSEDYVGHLVPLEAEGDIPFIVNRIYYITDVPQNISRGFHSHRNLEQVLICVQGSVVIKVSTPNEEEHIKLDRVDKGLYVGPMVWREMYNFSSNAVLLVLASRHYDEEDYIRDYERYCMMADDFFGGEKENDSTI